MAIEETKPASTETVEEEVAPAVESSTEAPLSRKRTRDDFEADNKEEAEEEERKIAPMKRRKSVTEETKDDTAIEKLKKIDPIAEGSKEGTADVEEPEKEDKTVAAEATAETAEATAKTTDDDLPTPKVEEEKTSTEETKETEKEETKPSTAPRFVFGATTPFGASAFSMINKKANVFDSASSTEKPATPSVFGSGSAFGNAFQSAIGKKSIFDKEENPTSTDEKDKESELETSNKTHMYKQVELEKKEIKSGEEDEEQVFTCRAKLYALDLTNVKLGWKERGVGNIHINKSKEVGKSSRIIMRSNGLLKVILNTALVQGLEVVKGMPSSMNPEKFIRITSVEDGKPTQYAIKTGNVETTETMFNTITDLIPQ